MNEQAANIPPKLFKLISGIIRYIDETDKQKSEIKYKDGAKK